MGVDGLGWGLYEAVYGLGSALLFVIVSGSGQRSVCFMLCFFRATPASTVIMYTQRAASGFIGTVFVYLCMLPG